MGEKKRDDLASLRGEPTEDVEAHISLADGPGHDKIASADGPETDDMSL